MKTAIDELEQAILMKEQEREWIFTYPSFKSIFPHFSR